MSTALRTRRLTDYDAFDNERKTEYREDVYDFVRGFYPSSDTQIKMLSLPHQRFFGERDMMYLYPNIKVLGLEKNGKIYSAASYNMPKRRLSGRPHHTLKAEPHLLSNVDPEAADRFFAGGVCTEQGVTLLHSNLAYFLVQCGQMKHDRPLATSDIYNKNNFLWPDFNGCLASESLCQALTCFSYACDDDVKEIPVALTLTYGRVDVRGLRYPNDGTYKCRLKTVMQLLNEDPRRKPVLLKAYPDVSTNKNGKNNGTHLLVAFIKMVHR